MLWDIYLLPIHVSGELLVNANYFLEVQLLEINIHPPNEEIDEIGLLQLVTSKAAQGFQHFRELPVEIIEAIYLGQALAILLDEFDIVCD